MARIARTLATDVGAVMRAGWAFSFIGRTVASRLAPLDRHDAVELAEDSWILRTIERFFEVSVIAWRGSSVRTWIERTFLSSAGADARIAIVGWMAVSASLTHMALVGFDRLLGPTGAGAGWLALLAIGVVCIRKPAAVAEAFAAARLRRPRNDQP